MKYENFEFGWVVDAFVDHDGHLNVHVSNRTSASIDDTVADVRARNGDALRLRFTTPEIEGVCEDCGGSGYTDDYAGPNTAEPCGCGSQPVPQGYIGEDQ